MTFEEWWDKYPFRSSEMIGPRWDSSARSAWEAATTAERERCATVCDQIHAMSLDPMVCRGSAEECAEAIREV